MTEFEDVRLTKDLVFSHFFRKNFYTSATFLEILEVHLRNLLGKAKFKCHFIK